MGLTKAAILLGEPIKLEQLTEGHVILGVRGAKIASMIGKQGTTNKIVMFQNKGGKGDLWSGRKKIRF